MSVGLLVSGSVGLGKPGSAQSAGHAAMARRVADWFERKHGDLLVTPTMVYSNEEGDRVEVDLYAGTEPFSLAFSNDGTVTADANTGWGGPGFHKWVCELLDALGSEHGIAWEKNEEADETGYFVERNWNRLTESMLDWAAALCRTVAEHAAKAEHMSIGMPCGFRIAGAGGVLTGLGVRSHTWFVSAAKNSALLPELMGWMDPEQDARCWKNRALSAMWLHVRWCAPRTEAEARLNAYVLRCLQVAHDLDDEIALPWAAWKELAELNETPIPSKAVARANKEAEAPKIGYRRGVIGLTPQDGWHFELPGSMSEAVDDEGNQLWFDDTCTVRFSSFGVDSGKGKTPSAKQLAEELSAPAGEACGSWTQEGAIGRMGVEEYQEEDGETSTNYQAVVAARGEFAVCTVTGPDRSIAEFAEGVCRSISGPTGPARR